MAGASLPGRKAGADAVLATRRCGKIVQEGVQVFVLDFSEIASIQLIDAQLQCRTKSFQLRCLYRPPLLVREWDALSWHSDLTALLVAILSTHPIHRDRITRGGSVGREGASAPLAGAAPMASASSLSRKPMLMRP